MAIRAMEDTRPLTRSLRVYRGREPTACRKDLISVRPVVVGWVSAWAQLNAIRPVFCRYIVSATTIIAALGAATLCMNISSIRMSSSRQTVKLGTCQVLLASGMFALTLHECVIFILMAEKQVPTGVITLDVVFRSVIVIRYLSNGYLLNDRFQSVTCRSWQSFR